jgi:hypothetical protein
MKLLVLVFICAGLLPAQTQLTPDETRQLATRMLQLMESAAVAIPGLTAAATPVKQNADAAFAELEHTPLAPAITWRFMFQVKAPSNSRNYAMTSSGFRSISKPC